MESPCSQHFFLRRKLLKTPFGERVRILSTISILYCTNVGETKHIIASIFIFQGLNFKDSYINKLKKSKLFII